jgi:DNA-binding NarL/FixJ family response regulator
MDREVGEKFDLGYSLSLHARAAYLAHSQEEAIQVVGELERFLVDAPYPYLLATAIELRGLLSAAVDPENAAQLFEEAARGFGDLANSLDQARCLLLAAKSMASDGDSKTTAIALLRKARELADSSESRDQQNRIEALMRTLGVRPRAGRPRGKTVEGALSPREAEVVVLVAVGASNADIGHRLYLSDRTVQDHITHALRKLGLSSRAALASWAAKQGMI